MITYKRGAGTIVAKDIRPDNNSVQLKKLMSQDTLTLSFTSSVELDLRIGDYCLLYGQKYTINQPPSDEKSSLHRYNYTVTLEAEMYDLSKTEYLFLGDNNLLNETDFSLMGDIQTFANLIISNLERLYPGVWTLGTIANSDFKNLTFSQDNCLSALGKIATAFSTEFFFQGNTIHIYIRQEDSGLTFRYGMGKGLYNIKRSPKNNSNVITRLYAYGASTNISANYRNGSSRLLLPDSVYIEQNVYKYGIIEGVQVFPDIYPQRTGTISQIYNNDIYAFTDQSIDFNVNVQLIPGTTAKVTFQTGQLAGYQFDINTYTDSTKTFRINKNTNEKALDIPSSLLKPAVGDTYIITDIIMPDTYVADAEQLLLTKALDYLAQNSEPNISYVVECDPMYFKQKDISLVLGTNVRIIDDELGIDKQIRIISITRDTTNQYLYKIELADSLTPQILTRIIADQAKTGQFLNINKLTDVNRARRNWKDTQELESLIFDTEGNYYSSKIKPLSIETTMLAVGARSQQLVLNGIVLSPNYLGDPEKLNITAGALVNFTIGSLPITWNISAVSYFNLTAGVAYYIYGKCLKSGTTGQIFLSTDKITFDQDPVYYHFLLGVLHSDIDGVRGMSLTYGQTTINGRFITTGVIQSNDELTYFDLDNGEIGGKIVFKAGSSGYNNLTDKPDLSILASIDFVNTIKGDLQSQIDGEITSWFYAYVPGLTNAPVTDWTTNTIKDNHLGDLFYNTSTGYAYRFAKNSGVYSWIQIIDTDVVLALQNASKAQDTADHKRRVFIVQPYAPYDPGDLWTDGSNLYKCITAKVATGAFDISDWQLATVYDSTKTVIDGGLITSGSILLGNGTGINAGITGEGALASSVRVWAGAAYADRATAPFRVTQDGHVVMTQADVTGIINSTQGKIGGWTITAQGLENSDIAGAHIKQSIDLGGGNKIESSIGTNITQTGVLASFINTQAIPNVSNTGVFIYVQNGDFNGVSLSPNNALDVTGDTFFNGSVTIKLNNDQNIIINNVMDKFWSNQFHSGNVRCHVSGGIQYLVLV